jgi:plastocyanin
MIRPMRTRGKSGALLAGAACACALVAAGAAWAAPDTILAVNSIDFDSDNYNQDQGERPTFQNNDAGIPHNVTATDKGPDGKPLFRSATITGVAAATLNGTQYADPGAYDFICTIHPSMQAKLHVSGMGTPVARPDIEVSILSSRLGRVRRSGKARVKIRALTLSDDAALKLKLGNKTLASISNVDLAAGQSRALTLHLSRRARMRLAGRRRAKVKLVGTVPFGAPDTASKVLS